jgi:hypothetical protein
MNTTIRNLIVALPLATAALTMTPGAAMADPSGPGGISAPTPGPIGPGDLTNPEPEPTNPTGPGDLTAPQPCPTHGDCGGNGGDDGNPGGGSGDNDGNGGDEPQGNQGGTTVSSIALPTRIDAGLAPEAGSDLELSWLLASGALVTASGVAFAARRVRVRA